MRGDDERPGPDIIDLQVTGGPIDDTRPIEIRPARPPRPVLAAGLAVVLLAAVAGYVLGAHHVLRNGDHSTDAKPDVVVAGPTAVRATGDVCSAQLGDQLELGVEIVNTSSAVATLHPVRINLPLGGLTPLGRTWGGCGQITPQNGIYDFSLGGGATTWATVVFEVRAGCPAPLPVLFTLDYDQGGKKFIADLHGFSDLGDVPYTSPRCPDRSS